MDDLRKLLELYESKTKDEWEFITVERGKEISNRIFNDAVLKYILDEKILENTVWDFSTDVRTNSYVADEYNMLYFGSTGLEMKMSEKKFREKFHFLPFSSRGYITLEMITTLCDKEVIINLWTNVDSEEEKREVSIYLKYYGETHPNNCVDGNKGIDLILSLVELFRMKISDKSIDKMKYERDKLMKDFDGFFERLETYR